MRDRSQRVYFARCIGPRGDPIGAYKIGCSHGMDMRVRQLTANMPFTAELVASVPGSYVLEAICHLSLKADHIRGEYFHASERLERIVDYAAREGVAFSYINDLGTREVPDGALQAFMRYHDVSVEDFCEVLGGSPKQYEKQLAKPRYNPRKTVAAVAIAASRRLQYVNWPNDALLGLCGKVSPAVERRRQAA